ncbi:Aste57867_3537 [Aphanomyces stellatus]|uniref:Aste57867_3537 protein n=1 Tax=Aphanomyces stellatus TaxID=120398 RepID=A0A485KCB4_9STRA|nr:hypothetical protein As57867_003526 [Aphanomyces stellatus]VFT80700.1 Aste57867_3537 [Aphanomyces stellatus]
MKFEPCLLALVASAVVLAQDDSVHDIDVVTSDESECLDDAYDDYTRSIPSKGGWFPCPLMTNMSNPLQQGPTPGGLNVQCNVFTVPLCYKTFPGYPDDDVCDSNQTIDVFVKRIQANTTTTSQRKPQAFWISEGGPGYAMQGVEELMRRSFIALNGTWSVYSMDHRGTGRSHRLTCNDTRTDLLVGANATQLFADCIGRYQKTYGQENAAGFGVTSAAMDLSTLSRHVEPDADWFMYGLSYATLLVERVMHMRPPHVKGYVVDAVVPETMVLPNGDAEYGKVANRILHECDKWPACASKFQNVSLATAVRQFYKDVETLPRLQYCREWLKSVALRPYEPASWAAKKLFASMIGYNTLPQLMPVLLYRLNRCEPKDYPALVAAAKYIQDQQMGDPNSLSTFDSLVLYQIVLASERALWHSPPPPLTSMMGFFAREVVTEGTYRDFQSYCLLTGSGTEVCQKYPATGDGFYYGPDSFTDTVARIPQSASLLVMNGDLDPVTPEPQAKHQFDQYKGRGTKLYVNVPQSAHPTTETPCGFAILVSYLANAGRVAKVDTSCIKLIPNRFSVDVKEIALAFFNSTDELI